MGTHNIRLYKEFDKKYTGCNLKTTELLDCALIGVCVIIRSIGYILHYPMILLADSKSSDQNEQMSERYIFKSYSFIYVLLLFFFF